MEANQTPPRQTPFQRQSLDGCEIKYHPLTASLCRSILVEATFNHLSSKDWQAMSAGSKPTGQAHPRSLALLERESVLFLYFRHSIPARYDVNQLKPPREAIRDPATFRAGWTVMALLLIGFLGLEPLGVPISLVAAAGSLVLLAVATRSHIINTRKIVRESPWQIVIFSLGMYLVVYGLRNEGLTGYITNLLDVFASYGVWGATLGTGF